MRLAVTSLWLLAGAALTGAAYWTFLITPESTASALALSALLLLVSFFLLAMTLSGAILGWSRGPSAQLFRSAVTSASPIVPAALIFGAIWWLVGSVTDQVTIYSGQINAWFIATLGWDDISLLFRAINWVAIWLKWVVASMLALSLMSAVITSGWRALAGLTWIRHALSPPRLGLATLSFGILVAAPWRYLAPWRPDGLPATAIEMAFIAGKLSLTALLMAIGTSLMIRQATWTTSTPSLEN